MNVFEKSIIVREVDSESEERHSFLSFVRWVLARPHLRVEEETLEGLSQDPIILSFEPFPASVFSRSEMAKRLTIPGSYEVKLTGEQASLWFDFLEAHPELDDLLHGEDSEPTLDVLMHEDADDWLWEDEGDAFFDRKD